MRLTGLGSSKFNANVESILALCTLLSQKISLDCLEPWTPHFDQHEYLNLEFMNRYFSSRRSSQEVINFSDQVDPRGSLKLMASKNNWVHTLDNEVKYYERSTIQKDENQ